MSHTSTRARPKSNGSLLRRKLALTQSCRLSSGGLGALAAELYRCDGLIPAWDDPPSADREFEGPTASRTCLLFITRRLRHGCAGLEGIERIRMQISTDTLQSLGIDDRFQPRWNSGELVATVEWDPLVWHSG